MKTDLQKLAEDWAKNYLGPTATKEALDLVCECFISGCDFTAEIANAQLQRNGEIMSLAADRLEELLGQVAVYKTNLENPSLN